MTGTEVAREALESTRKLLVWYLADLADEDLYVQPVPGANTIGWQLHHLIESEVLHLSKLPGAIYEGVKSPGERGTKSDYVAQFSKVRDASLANVARLTDADLDQKHDGLLKAFAPRIGDLIILIANHTLMHAGQFTVVRRKLGKPVLF